MKLKKRDCVQIAFIAFLFVCISLAFLDWFDETSFVLSLALMLAILLLIIFDKYRRITDIQQNDMKSLESHISLINVLNPEIPLWLKDGFSACSDYLNIVAREILIRKPQQILECGSGLSSIVSSYILKRNNSGKILSLEHLEWVQNAVNKELVLHNLEDFADVVHSPLVEVSTSIGKMSWYKSDIIDDLDEIDMVIVDGPPKHTHKMARYPLLELVYKKLAKDAIIIMDDTNRKDEAKILKIWKHKYPNIIIRRFLTKQGAAIIEIRK